MASSPVRPPARLLAALAVAVIACGAPTPTAEVLAGRLVAPCCWMQTLDTHASPLASELRAELRDRVARGEPSQAIEDDLVARYGERMRAVPRGDDPRTLVPLVASALTLAGLAVLIMLTRRWTHRGVAMAAVTAAVVAPRPVTDEAYEDRLDDELADQDL